jgi:hypothetical protein
MSDTKETELAFWRRHCKEAESQNQALQEENERLSSMLWDDHTVNAFQERAEKAEGLLRRLYFSTAHTPELDAEVRQLLSPTQETDPE